MRFLSRNCEEQNIGQQHFLKPSQTFRYVSDVLRLNITKVTPCSHALAMNVITPTPHAVKRTRLHVQAIRWQTGAAKVGPSHVHTRQAHKRNYLRLLFLPPGLHRRIPRVGFVEGTAFSI